MRRIFIAAVLFVTLMPSFGATQSAPVPMPPAVKEAFDKGMAAVEQTEWALAADSFSRAWRANKQSSSPEKPEPDIVFNWGLAESKIPGRELRAIACFNLYLNLGDKEAANADAVRKEKTNLEVRNEARLRKMIGEAKRLGSQLQGDDEFRRRVRAGGYDLNKSVASLRRVALRRVAVAQARAGDFTGAKQAAEQARIPSGTSLAAEAILVAQGDYHGADEGLAKNISDLQAEAENNPDRDNFTRSRFNRAMLLRDTLVSSQFSKASLTDPGGTLQALAGKGKPEELFDGYMRVIEDMVYILRRTDGRNFHVSD